MVANLPGSLADPNRDEIRLDGHKLDPNPPKVYLALNKPAGYVCTLSDRHAVRKVTDLITGMNARVYPVGRLDRDSAGLLFLTNDGDFAFQLTHPSHSVSKVYRLVVRGFLSQHTAQRLARGITLEEGTTRPAEVRIVEHDAKTATTVLDITLREGRKRQLRRMLETVGHPVLALTRTAIGPVQLAGLAPGTWRKLRVEEVTALQQAVPIAASPPRPSKPERPKAGAHPLPRRAPRSEHARFSAENRMTTDEVSAAAKELQQLLGRRSRKTKVNAAFRPEGRS